MKFTPFKPLSINIAYHNQAVNKYWTEDNSVIISGKLCLTCSFLLEQDTEASMGRGSSMS